MSFPEPKQLKEWEMIQEEAAKRDHRKIGRVSKFYPAKAICNSNDINKTKNSLK